MLVTLILSGWTTLNAVATDAIESDGSMRLITLAPHLTELVYTVGAEDRLVGVIEWSDYPTDALAMPRIGDAFRMNLERIVALGTTHALSWVGGTPSSSAAQLEAIGIELIPIDIRSLDDIASAMQVLGNRLGTSETAQTAIEAFTRARADLTADSGSKTPVRVFYQVAKQPLYTLGGEHVINEVFSLCGARNVFEDLAVPAGIISPEAVIIAQPQALIAGAQRDPNLEDRGQAMSAPLAYWQQFEALPAVACGHTWTVDPALLIRPTPRILEGAAALCRWLDGIRPALAEDPACSSVGVQ
ncbi:MAG: ABC transporter substrate-binding protein [Pseudomonadota bacterium]